MEQLFHVLIMQSERYKDVLMPGYTHLQIAMPSSFGLWFGAQDVFLVVGIESRVTGFGKQFADVSHLGTHHDFVVEEGEGDIARIQYIFPCIWLVEGLYALRYGTVSCTGNQHT